MTTVLLVIHLLISLALVGVILLQRSEGGALGIGGGGAGGGGAFGGLMTGRGSANMLTRITAILAVCFIAMSMLLAIMGSREAPRPIFDAPPQLPVEDAIPEVPPPAAAPTAPAAPVAD